MKEYKERWIKILGFLIQPLKSILLTIRAPSESWTLTQGSLVCVLFDSSELRSCAFTDPSTPGTGPGRETQISRLSYALGCTVCERLVVKVRVATAELEQRQSGNILMIKDRRPRFNWMKYAAWNSTHRMHTGASNPKHNKKAKSIKGI